MVSRYAVIQDGVCTNIILWDGGGSWTPPVDAQVVPYNPATHVIDVPIDVQNANSLRAKAAQALTTNATFLAIASPTNAQVSAQVKALTRQVDAIIRLLVVNDTSTISDT